MDEKSSKPNHGHPKKHKKSAPGFILWIEYLLLRLISGTLRLLPLKMAYGITKAMMFLVYWVDFRHRKRSITHILHSGIRSNLQEAKALAYASFINMGKVFVEIVKAPQYITEENFREHFALEATDEDIKHYFTGESGENAIIVSGHIGNWELAGMAYTLLSGKQLVSIMRPLNNPYMGDYIYSHRQSSRHTTVSKAEGVLPLFKALLRGQSIAIVADQHASHGEGVDISFFGHPASAHKSPSLLSIRTKRTILVGALVRLDDDMHFKLLVEKAIDFAPTGNREEDVQRLTQLYSDKLEGFIRRYPEQWLWSHRRWLDCNRKSRTMPKPETQS